MLASSRVMHKALKINAFFLCLLALIFMNHLGAILGLRLEDSFIYRLKHPPQTSSVSKGKRGFCCNRRILFLAFLWVAVGHKSCFRKDLSEEIRSKWEAECSREKTRATK